MRISQATREIQKHPQLEIVGAHVDCVYFLKPIWEGSAVLDDLVRAHRFSNGESIFHLKNEPAVKVPRWPQKEPEKVEPQTFAKPKWVKLKEEELENLVGDLMDRLLEHKGLLLTGPAGVGKTFLLHELLHRLRLKFPKQKQIISALRHCAAMLVGGKTIQHYICKYSKGAGSPKAGTIMIIDECSEVQLHTWAILAQWKLMGVIFIVVGDFDGQQKPIFDRWNDAMDQNDIRKSNFLHEMCGGLHVQLTVYRRGCDQLLLNSYTGLYRQADNKNPDELEYIMEKVMGRYPWNYESIDKFFTKSHRLRILINAAVNKRLVTNHRKKIFIPAPKGGIRGATTQPQDMWIWEGMQMLCTVREPQANKPVNGGVYVVEEIDEEKRKVTVRLHEDYRPRFEHHHVENPEDVENMEESESESEEEDGEIKFHVKESNYVADPEKVGLHILKYSDVAKYLRLQHALVHASVQGRTMRNEHIGILDCFTRNFTVRNMIVAMSRATHGQFVHVFSPEQQRDLLRQFQSKD